MQRHLLGLLAIVLIIVGLSLMILESFAQYAFLANSCWRIGLVLAALWLALPQLKGMSVWFRRAAIVVAVIAAAFSKYGLILLPLIFLMWIFSRKKPAASGPDNAMESRSKSA